MSGYEKLSENDSFSSQNGIYFIVEWKKKSHKCNFKCFGDVNVFSLSCSTLCPVHIYFWSFTSLIENGIYQPVHKYVSMACSIQKTKLDQVLS